MIKSNAVELRRLESIFRNFVIRVHLGVKPLNPVRFCRFSFMTSNKSRLYPNNSVWSPYYSPTYDDDS